MRYLYSIWCILSFVITFLALFPVFVILSLFGNWGRKAIWTVIRGWSFVWFFMIGMVVKIQYPYGKFDKKKNTENPEMYAVFPFRIFGVGKPDIELARRTFASRVDGSC